MLLFGKQEKTEAADKIIGNVVSLPVNRIQPNPQQPRAFFDDYALTQLAVSIQQNGILQPLTVRKTEAGYQLIAGERRLRAAKLVNMEYVPCIVLEREDKDSAVMAILENIQRADLNFMEEALAIKRLIEHYGLTQEEAASKLGMAQSTVANKLRLLRLTDEDKVNVLKFGLNERQARAVIRLPEAMRSTAIKEIYIKQMNSSQTDRYVEQLLKAVEEEMRPKPKIICRTNPMNTIGLYINSLNKTVEAMKSAGIVCDTQKRKTDEFIEYMVKIPLR
ncbi:MAG: ParB/RepB/Spo0J family partition protein [Firmicutes bacterium]|nr:ParB/RepB/Spo0J family partition protein [[Eubacterium] siraeum]MCM1488263.1 ParB/RepB/Spo0J family partition protein [Bacillota bacterium]